MIPTPTRPDTVQPVSSFISRKAACSGVSLRRLPPPGKYHPSGP